LIETNPYLRDPEKRKKLILKAVSTSTAIETKSYLAGFLEPLKPSKTPDTSIILREPEAPYKPRHCRFSPSVCSPDPDPPTGTGFKLGFIKA
jgi:hypothetical protein